MRAEDISYVNQKSQTSISAESRGRFYPLENPLPAFPLSKPRSSVLTFPCSPLFSFFLPLSLSLSLYCLLREAAHVYLPLSGRLIPAAVKDSTK